MRSMMLMAGAAAIALATPLYAQGQGRGQGGHGKGHDVEQRDRGEGKGQAANRGRGAERGERAARPDRGPRGREARAERGNRGQGNAERRAERGVERDERRAERDVRRADRDVRRAERRGVGVRTVEIVEAGPVVRFRNARGRGLINGCPPGLARRNNGCLPPGIARQIAAGRTWADGLWRVQGDGLYRYSNGYLFRMRPDGLATAYLPLAGGALWRGNPWPVGYGFDPVPAYYPTYFGYNDAYAYRYADGIMYGVDPETSTIRQIAALLTGDPWAVGGAMPAGYGVYNVPFGYRDQYVDTADAWYRYNDGYVYRVDPTTQLVQAAIQLLG